MKTTTLNRNTARILAGSIAAFVALGSAEAASIFWLGTTNGNFNANNWTGTSGAAMVPTLVPANADVLNFDTAETNFAGNFAINNDLTLTGLTLAISDNSATDDFSLSGNAISVGSGGITSNVGTGTGSTLGFGGSGITLDAAASFNAVLGDLTINSAVDNGGNLLTVTGVGNTTITGTITGIGGLTKTNAGSLTLTGANTYTGGTNVNGGTLSLGNATALGTTGNVSFGGGTVQFNTGSTPDFSARIKNSASAITLDTNGVNVTFAGLIDNTNTGGLVKTGLGTLILTNSANTYTGGTTVSGGILQASRSGSGTFSFGGTVTLANGTSLFTNTGNGIFTMPTHIDIVSGAASLRADNGGTLSAGDLIITGPITGAGGLITTGSNNSNRRKVELQGAKTFLGGVTLQQTVAPNGTFFTNTAAYTRTRLVIFDKVSLGTGTLRSELLKVDGANTGGLEVPNGNTSSAGTNFGLETGTGVTNAIDLATGANLNVTTSQTNALQLSGVISGAGSFTTRAPSTNPINLFETNPNNLPGLLILSGANTYTGSTFVNTGTLQIGNGGTVGSLSPSSAIILQNPNAAANGATLTFNINNYIPTLAFKRSDTLTQGVDFAATISGNLGKVAQTGSGTTILNGTNTYTGGTTISAGILNVNADAALGAAAGAVSISNGAILQASGTVTTAARTLTLGAGGGAIDTNGNDVNFNSGSTVTGTTLTKTGSGTLNFGLLSGLTGLGALAANDGVTNVNSALGTGASTVTATGTAGVKFGSVSQTLGSLTIGAGATVTFTSGLAAFGGGGKGPGSGAAVVPEPGSIGLLLTGALGVLARRRRLA